MFYNMRQYYELKKDNVFKYVPLTFHIIKGLEDKEYKNFLAIYLKRQKECKKNIHSSSDQEEEDEEEDQQIDNKGSKSPKKKKLK